MKKIIKNFTSRKLISSTETKISYLQLLGIALIVLGIIAILVCGRHSSSTISVSFFITMLGVAFAFPSLLEGSDGLSTMRIVVFMMTNVICMLLLKIGWEKDITSLGNIGLDANWMGVIAFVFGAKATQSYFEGKTTATTGTNSSSIVNTTMLTSDNLNSSEVINKAIEQNQNLKNQYPNIENLLLGSKSINGQNVFCVDIHLNDNNTSNIPTQLPVNIEGKQGNVPVNIIPLAGNIKTQTTKGDSIKNQTANGAPGTLGCFLTDYDKQALYALSCCHVFTSDQWINYSGYNVPNDEIIDTTTGEPIGNWIFGLMNSSFDIAYAKVNNNLAVAPSKFNQPRNVNDIDILHKTPILFNGASTPNGSGFITNYNCSRKINYNGQDIEINNLILISNNGISPSQAGDSGALVYTKYNYEPIGIILAANTTFSYLVPITSILSITGKIIY